jgi:hypothetical protein
VTRPALLAASPADELAAIADDARSCADSILSPLLAARVRVLAEELAVIAVQIEDAGGREKKGATR